MSQQNYKDLIKAEYKRCLEDPIYFMRKYAKIQHPLKGTCNFDLYPFQEQTLTDLVNNDLNIILKSRQMGISTLTAAYSLWLMTFFTDKNILIISITQETAKEIVTKVRFANDNLPAWMKVQCVEDNRLSLRLKNGSQIKAVSSAGTAGRSAALSLLIIDEAGFIDNIEEIWLSSQYTLSTGGRAIILSTPNGVGNFFHKTWVASEAGENKFNKISLPWHLHPERDQSWRDLQTQLSGIKGAAQECDCLWGESRVKILDKNTGEKYEISLENLYSQLVRLNNRFQILTPSGYQDFFGVRKLKKNCHYIISLNNGKTIKCSDNHPFIFNLMEIRSQDLKIGSKITGVNGIDVEIISITKVNTSIDLYDVINVNNGNIFNVDGIVSHNCEFSTSGNQVVAADILEFYKITHIKDPVERRGAGYDLWIWERPDYTKNYMVTADCARGDGEDYSAFHVFNVESLEQVAEYKGQISTKDYGNLLVTIATEYNNALLVIENNNIGWASLQQVINRDYQNLFYSSTDLKVVDIERTYNNKLNSTDKKATPGFTTTGVNRQLIINNIESLFRERNIIIHSVRLYEELNVFVWNGAKAEAMKGYNDDLVMSLGIGLWVRDTALKIRTEQMAYTRVMLDGIHRVVNPTPGPPALTKIIQSPQETWQFATGAANTGKKESLTWLL